jgi:hypothetical protein
MTTFEDHSTIFGLQASYFLTKQKKEAVPLINKKKKRENLARC